MARVLFDGLVEYEDGTPSTTSQMAKDVVEFLSFTAEPEHDDRKVSPLLIQAADRLAYGHARRDSALGHARDGDLDEAFQVGPDHVAQDRVRPAEKWSPLIAQRRRFYLQYLTPPMYLAAEISALLSVRISRQSHSTAHSVCITAPEYSTALTLRDRARHRLHASGFACCDSSSLSTLRDCSVKRP